MQLRRIADNSISYQCKSPVLFLVFNRPKQTELVLEAIRTVQPKQLFIAADGPRSDVDGEEEKTNLVREIATKIDWDCEITTLFRKKNLGCGQAVSDAISWFFRHTEAGIILEDDCLPHWSFFKFCDELLESYKDDGRIMQISGSNMRGDLRVTESYYFSQHGPIWGWATWRRAWQKYHYQVPIQTVQESLDCMQFIWDSHYEGLIRRKQFLEMHLIDSWDFQWLFAKTINCAWTIIPSVNMVENIGFGEDATHTTASNRRMQVELREARFPLKPPTTFIPNRQLSREYFIQTFRKHGNPFYWIEKVYVRILGIIK